MDIDIYIFLISEVMESRYKIRGGPCRQPHLRPTESCKPSQKRQTAAKSAV